MGVGMGLNVVAGSWLEGTNPLVSTAVGALAFWVLGAVVGLCVRFYFLPFSLPILNASVPEVVVDAVSLQATTAELPWVFCRAAASAKVVGCRVAFCDIDVLQSSWAARATALVVFSRLLHRQVQLPLVADSVVILETLHCIA